MDATNPPSTTWKAARLAHALAEFLRRPDTDRRSAEFFAHKGIDLNHALRLALDLDELAAPPKPPDWWLDPRVAATLKDAALRTGVKYSCLQRWATHGLIRAHQHYRSRRWIVHLEDVQRVKSKAFKS